MLSGGVTITSSLSTSMRATTFAVCVRNMEVSATTFCQHQFPIQWSRQWSHCALTEGAPGMNRRRMQTFPVRRACRWRAMDDASSGGSAGRYASACTRLARPSWRPHSSLPRRQKEAGGGWPATACARRCEWRRSPGQAYPVAANRAAGLVALEVAKQVDLGAVRHHVRQRVVVGPRVLVSSRA